MFDAYDLNAWDNTNIIGVGDRYVTASLALDGSSTAFDDYNVGLHFYLDRVNLGESRYLCFIYLAGDTLEELESNLVETKRYAEALCAPVGGVLVPPFSIYILATLLVLISDYYIKQKF